MWENIAQEARDADYSWLERGMKNGTLVWCADESYNRKIAPDISGVGWIVKCIASGENMEGSFYEISDDANAYRAEQLGMCTNHHLVSALSRFDKVEKWSTKAVGDNEGTVKLTRRRLKRIRPGMKCADILRNVRTARNDMTTNPNYFHVYGHMDDYLTEDKLSFEQKLNKRCDELAKGAVELAVGLTKEGQVRRGSQLLPKEKVAVMVSGVKIAGDLGDAVRYAKGMEEAREFLVKEIGWSLEKFESVDWRNLHLTLKSKPDGYKMWRSKQHSGFCGTRVMVKYYSGDKEADVSCPNCGCIEKSSHLCVCMDEDRTRLLVEMSQSLEAWMHKDGKTDPEVAYWVSKYIEARGSI